MMTILPNCPICESDELWFNGRGAFATIKCYECGWNADIKLPLSVDALSNAITATVAAAKPHAGDDAGA